MVQRHSIVLWKKAEKKDKSFDEISKNAYDVLKLFQDYPYELRPNYLPAPAKEDIQEIDWSYSNFKELLKQGINKEGRTVFDDLGYSVSFFSSLDEECSTLFSMTVGSKFEKLYNVLTVNLSPSLNLYDPNTATMISDLFARLVHVYEPFWGCVSNRTLSRKYGKFLEGNLPTTVHWINYWSESTAYSVGIDKIQKALSDNRGLSFVNGILIMKATALDMNKEEDIQYHAELHKALFST